MQAVRTLPPPLVPQYPRQSLNGIPAPLTPAGPSIMQTPPLTTRKRKRAHQYTVNYSEVQEVDSEGKVREVIVIEDTPPPPTLSPSTPLNGPFSGSYQPPSLSSVRTRARAAAEAQALSASSSSAIAAPAPKKRKRQPAEEVRAPTIKKPVTSGLQLQVPTKTWDSGRGPADVRSYLSYASI